VSTTEATTTEATEVDPRALVERPQKDVTFVARCHNLILSIFPELNDNYMGMRIHPSPGYRLQFVGGAFTVTPDLRRDFERFVHKFGRHYAYDDQDYEERIDRPLEDFIRAKASYNSSNPDGFYEMTPTIPEPTAELRAIIDAFVAGDEAAIERILEDEAADHGRPEVIEAGNKALESIYLARTQAAVQQEETYVPPSVADEEVAGPDDP
jgi:hypothetical protein